VFIDISFLGIKERKCAWHGMDSIMSWDRKGGKESEGE
jgi:hypothetical protein